MLPCCDAGGSQQTGSRAVTWSVAPVHCIPLILPSAENSNYLKGIGVRLNKYWRTPGRTGRYHLMGPFRVTLFQESVTCQKVTVWHILAQPKIWVQEPGHTACPRGAMLRIAWPATPRLPPQHAVIQAWWQPGAERCSPFPGAAGCLTSSACSPASGCWPRAAGAGSALVLWQRRRGAEAEGICASAAAAGSLSRTLISSQGLGELLRLGK